MAGVAVLRDTLAAAARALTQIRVNTACVHTFLTTRMALRLDLDAVAERDAALEHFGFGLGVGVVPDGVRFQLAIHQ